MNFYYLFIRALPFTSLLLCGCLYTTHQFNTGRTVPAGVSTFTMGFGTHADIWEDCPQIFNNQTPQNPGGDMYWGYPGGDGKCHYEKEFNHLIHDSAFQPDSFTTSPVLYKDYLPKFSLGYRLGVRDSWGPFTGVDMGIHFEAPTLYASVLFDMRIGLPSLPFKNAYHAAGIGFIMGAWADNGYFADYAVSKSMGKFETYAHCRIIYHNTLISFIEEEELIENFKIPHYRKWVGQFSGGAKWVLPDITAVPDFIIPHITVTYPMVHTQSYQAGKKYRKKFELKFNVGIGWDF